MGICTEGQVLSEARGLRFPWSWNYWQLWAALCGFSESKESNASILQDCSLISLNPKTLNIKKKKPTQPQIGLLIPSSHIVRMPAWVWASQHRYRKVVHLEPKQESRRAPCCSSAKCAAQQRGGGGGAEEKGLGRIRVMKERACLPC